MAHSEGRSRVNQSDVGDLSVQLSVYNMTISFGDILTGVAELVEPDSAHVLTNLSMLNDDQQYTSRIVCWPRVPDIVCPQFPTTRVGI